MTGPARIYLSYLLRMWRAGGDGPWRASIECVQTGERETFAALEALFAYLCEQAGEAEVAPPQLSDPTGSRNDAD